jgi:AGZA family xanthine/uracil permease-like MFS transporter
VKVLTGRWSMLHPATQIVAALVVVRFAFFAD